MRRATCSGLVSLFLVLALGLAVEGSTLWTLHQRAKALEARSNIDEAIPLWFQLAEGYARQGNWTNAAI